MATRKKKAPKAAKKPAAKKGAASTSTPKAHPQAKPGRLLVTVEPGPSVDVDGEKHPTFAIKLHSILHNGRYWSTRYATFVQEEAARKLARALRTCQPRKGKG